MTYAFVHRIYRHVNDEISLRDVWAIRNEELNATAEIIEKHLHDEKELSRLHHDVAWLSQALIEFASILDFPSPQERLWWRKNYLYFEAVNALREAVVGMLNGVFRSSIGTLRSALQMFLLHCWWQERMMRGKKTKHFCEWLEGKRDAPPFKNMLRDNLSFFDMPSNDAEVEKAYKIFEQLCPHVHAPLIEESLTTLRQGNVRSVTTPALLYWLTLARDTLRMALDHFVHHRPQSLFPVDIPRKFGFNPPVGMYADKFSFVALNAALGDERIRECREKLRDHDIVQSVTDFYEMRPDYTAEQISATWDDDCRREFGDDIPGNLDACWFLVKNKLRVTSMVMAYTSDVSSK